MPSEQILRSHGSTAMGCAFLAHGDAQWTPREPSAGARRFKLKLAGAFGASQMVPKISLENFVLRSQIFEAAKWHPENIGWPE